MSYFITIYTDASVRPLEKKVQVAWKGKCNEGSFEGFKILDGYNPDIGRAEMIAIYYAILNASRRFPTLEGFFVNIDNIQVVKSFWPRAKIHHNLKDVYDHIQKLLNGRWIRTKHVKAHTGKKDIRSYMNHTVDKLTRKQK